MKKKYNTPRTSVTLIGATSFLCMADLSTAVDVTTPAPVRLTGPKQEARILYV